MLRRELLIPRRAWGGQGASYVQRAGGDGGRPWWPRLVEDLAALGSGVVGGREAARDPDGTLWKVALVFVKCDEDVRANDFGLAHFAARDEVCPFRPLGAEKEPIPPPTSASAE